MFITKRGLSRRTFLHGVGAAVALPWLDSMVPAFSTKAYAATVPRRFGAVYTPHGCVMQSAPHAWTPEAAGANFPITPILRPVERHRDYMTIVSGLSGDPRTSDQHAQASVGFLSGVLPKVTQGRDIQGGRTVDQMIAAKIGQETMFPSLEVATEDFTGNVGACDFPYSCAYLNTISWQSESTPLPMETNPRSLFERLFGGTGTLDQRVARIQRGRSILDSIKPSADRLQQNLGAPDRARLADYLANIREIERRLERAEQQAKTELALPAAPTGVPADFHEHIALMYDLTAVALQADLTRVFTYMVSREASFRTFVELGVPDGFHSLSHHGGNPEKIEGMARVQTWMVSVFANFLDKLKAVPEADGTLLDHITIMYGSGMGDGNNHSRYPLPLGLFGGAQRPGGRHIALPAETPRANLLLTLVQDFGVEMNSLANSSGTLSL